MDHSMGSRIAGERVKRRWTQEQLAAEADISSKYLSEVERDNVNPSVDVLVRIAGSLNQSLDYLVRGT